MQNYSLLAKYYDHFMDHVAYSSWANFIENLITKNNLRTEIILEIAAGTCRLVESMQNIAYQQYICTDLSLPMLQQSKNSFPKAVVDICHIPFADNSVNMVLMTYDAFNYLNPEQASQALSEVRRVLQKGGAFIFDVSTEYNSLKWFDDYCDVLKIDGATIVRESNYDFNLAVQHNNFTFFMPTEEKDIYRQQKEHHVQYVYSEEMLEDWLCDKGFEVAAKYGDFELGNTKNNTERIHFMAVKP
ncbi:MAG: class I SAM-dependent methyltransferase [Fibrobacter sp.]|nr:class I SAM-dependent methyltransferase [Fibrobacter sp.]